MKIIPRPCIIFLVDGTSFHYGKHVFLIFQAILRHFSSSAFPSQISRWRHTAFQSLRLAWTKLVPKCKQTSDTLSMTYLSSVHVWLLRTRHPLYDLSVQCSRSTEDTDICWWKFVPTLPLKQVTIVQRYVKFVYNPLFFTSLGKSFYEIE